MRMTYIKRKEFQEIARGKVNHPVIAISGLSGSGKSMYSKMLQERLKKEYGLGLPIVEAGQFFRDEAEKRGMTVGQFGAMLKQNKKMAEETDVTVDTNTLKASLRKPGIYLGRLTVYVLGDNAYKIYLKADPMLAAKRIHGDPNRDETKRGLNVKQIKEEIVKRDRDNVDRYNFLYGIDYGKDVPAVADVVVKNDRAPDVVFEDLYKPLVKWMKKKGFIKS